MGIFKVYVGSKRGSNTHLLAEIDNLGIKGEANVKEFAVYWFRGISQREVQGLTDKVLYNPVNQFYYSGSVPRYLVSKAQKVEVVSNLGVIDPREASVKKVASDLGIRKDIKVKFGRLYLLYGKISKKSLTMIKSRLLMKGVIEHEVFRNEKPFIKAPRYKFKLITIPIRNVTEEKLFQISEKGGLSLNLEEMRSVKKYFVGLGRDPTDVELETIAQTWSEHCSHKTLKGSVVHNGQKIDNLLGSTIINPSQKLNKSYVVSAFKDNAGGVKIGDKVVCVKVETHNHPSAIEPVGGAETGTGGVIRDILGFGKGAKPISSIVCFGVGPQKMSYSRLPKGVLHPKAILSGVVQGTKSYGNQMGIPTDFFQDSLVVHKDYIGNPLVYCGTIGITQPVSAKKTQPRRGDLVVLLGGFTGRDGIHGATFSSTHLQEKSESISGGAVQIGDAIMEKKTLDAILDMKDKNLVSLVTDCGGGGLSSAVGETGASVGVRVNLEKVPKKYEGLTYTEIWISESQERMIVVTKPKNKVQILRICKRHSVPGTVIGKFTGRKKLELFYERNKVADFSMDFLHHGCPRVEKTSFWKRKAFAEPKTTGLNLSEELIKILKDPDIASKSTLAHQYDSTVQGRTFLGPLIGKDETVHSDVTTRQISPTSFQGIALSISVNPRLTLLSPRKMAHWVVAQILAKLAASGADSSKAALLDNFSWGSPRKTEVMGELVESLIGCKEAVEGFRVPFISGKDSLNNEYKASGREIFIPGTLLITGIAPIPDLRKTVENSFVAQGNFIFLVGFSDGNLGGSYFYKNLGYTGMAPPNIDFEKSKDLLKKLFQAEKANLIKSVSTIGKGGMALTLAKMSLASGQGAKVDITDVKRKQNISDHQVLFSESGMRFVIEIEKSKAAKLKKIFQRFGLTMIGDVGGNSLTVFSPNKIIDVRLNLLEQSYAKQF